MGRKDCGITYFAFQYAPALNDLNHKYKASLDELSKEALSGNGNSFSCNKNSSVKVWCTALIQLNGWKIPPNYPFKVK